MHTSDAHEENGSVHEGTSLEAHINENGRVYDTLPSVQGTHDQSAPFWDDEDDRINSLAGI